VAHPHAGGPSRGPLTIAVVTFSDTRTASDDEGGPLARRLIEAAGHRPLDGGIVPDDPGAMRAAVLRWLDDPECDAIVTTGGTGLSPRDRTPEVLSPLIERGIDGFGELFRALSYREIGPAAMLSRALAGTARDKVLFALPGSPKAVRLAVERLILPEIGHLVGQLRPGGLGVDGTS